jgi:hypothetical protein
MIGQQETALLKEAYAMTQHTTMPMKRGSG